MAAKQNFEEYHSSEFAKKHIFYLATLEQSGTVTGIVTSTVLAHIARNLAQAYIARRLSPRAVCLLTIVRLLGPFTLSKAVIVVVDVGVAVVVVVVDVVEVGRTPFVVDVMGEEERAPLVVVVAFVTVVKVGAMVDKGLGVVIVLLVKLSVAVDFVAVVIDVDPTPVVVVVDHVAVVVVVVLLANSALVVDLVGVIVVGLVNSVLVVDLVGLFVVVVWLAVASFEQWH